MTWVIENEMERLDSACDIIEPPLGMRASGL